MADNHVTVLVNGTDVAEVSLVALGREDSFDLPGSINGQPITVRFRRDESLDDDEYDHSRAKEDARNDSDPDDWVNCSQCTYLAHDATDLAEHEHYNHPGGTA